ncbi:hypothetical protein cypCar_00036488 [Cyprinus carpio]|nr:hypothetical protein cypCar_00036488 [Cyprinus carpio]
MCFRLNLFTEVWYQIYLYVTVNLCFAGVFDAETALPDPGLSSGVIVGIAAAVLLFLTAVVAVVVIYYCHKFSEPKKQVGEYYS